MSTSDVDVIIPAGSSPSALARLLGRLPAGFRPIVVSDGSHAGIVDVVRASASAQLVIEPRHGFGSASQAGLAVATASVVAIADPELEVAAQDLEHLVAAVVRGDADVALAARRPASSTVGRILERALTLGQKTLFGTPKPRKAFGNPTGARAAWRSDLQGLHMQDRGRHWAAEMLQRGAEVGLRIVELDGPASRRARHRATMSPVAP